jgi:phage shock protein PspC (stress-responsive transcriptional regulator)
MTEEYKRLYRSNYDRMFGGVCGGLGKYLDVDPTLIRLLFIAAALFGGHGLLIYIIMLILIPIEPTTEVVSK